MAEIPLTQGQIAIVSDDCYKELNQFKWCAHKKRGTYYAVRSGPRDPVTNKQIFIQMHREIMGVTDPAIEVDHEDGDGLNNQKTNLRVATRNDNMRNQRIPRNNTSGFKGVTWHKRDKKWQASIRANRVSIHLGYFDTAEDAARAYNEAARVHHGKFARLNFQEGL